MAYRTLSGNEDGSSGRIIIKMIGGRVGGKVKKILMWCLFLVFGRTKSGESCIIQTKYH
jgi:hypothetical protein